MRGARSIAESGGVRVMGSEVKSDRFEETRKSLHGPKQVARALNIIIESACRYRGEER
jgi:hypothetical protein